MSHQGFVKLDCGILDSSLWQLDPDRILFLTALCMAKPHELTERVPQLYVTKLEETGWKVPPGWYGFVEASPTAIIGRANLDRDPKRSLEALEALGQPEVESRSAEYEGRRLVRINGGFIVLNFMRDREKDYRKLNAERQKRYRERQKRNALRDVTVTPSNGSVTPNVTRSIREKREAECLKSNTEEQTILIPSAAPPEKIKRNRPKDFDEVWEYVKTKEGLTWEDADWIWAKWNGNGFTNNKQPILNWKATIHQFWIAKIFPSQKLNNHR
jgi:hypothetical protein